MSKPSGNSFSRKRAQWRDQIFDDRELLPADKVVAYVLARFLNSETFTAYPGAMTLADAANISLRTVRSALSHFVQNGHLKITTAKGGLSILTPVLFAGDEPEPATPPEKAKPKSKPNGTGNGNGHDKAHASWPADYKEIFWRNYPRQERYASTMKALDKIVRSRDCPDWKTFTAGLAHYKKHAEDGIEDRKYLLGSKRWLEEKGWNDRPESQRRNVRDMMP